MDTNVDTLLQFEETLSDQEVITQINALMEGVFSQDPLTGTQAAEARLQELLRSYPNCTALKFYAVAVYDAFQMFSPTADRQVQHRWRTRKYALLEQVRNSGSAVYWQAATIQLASLAIVDGRLEQAEHMLQELPKYTGDPTGVWAQYYLKKACQARHSKRRKSNCISR